MRVPNSGAAIGGKNQIRKMAMHDGQIRSFKGDIIPGQSFVRLNVECKFYQDFPFHLLFTGDCKQLDKWIAQLLQPSDHGDLNILCVKINRRGTFVAVEEKHGWTADNLVRYSSKDHGTWILVEFEHFFQKNSDLFRFLSCKTK